LKDSDVADSTPAHGSTPSPTDPRNGSSHPQAGEAFATLFARNDANLDGLAATLTYRGLDAEWPYGLFLITDVGGGVAATERAAVRASQILYRAVPCPVTTAFAPHFALVVPVPAPGAWAEAVETMRRLADDYRVIVVAEPPVTGLGLLVARHRRGVADLAVASTLSDHPRVVKASDLVVGRVVGGLDDDDQRALLMPLGPLLAMPEQARKAMLNTMHELFVDGAPMTTVAEHQCLHPNSVRYRLDRFEDATGLFLNHLPTAVRAHLAFQLLRLRSADLTGHRPLLRL
jgi:hypothetical protein